MSVMLKKAYHQRKHVVYNLVIGMVKNVSHTSGITQQFQHHKSWKVVCRMDKCIETRCIKGCDGTLFKILSPIGANKPVLMECITCHRQFEITTPFKIKLYETKVLADEVSIT